MKERLNRQKIKPEKREKKDLTSARNREIIYVLLDNEEKFVCVLLSGLDIHPKCFWFLNKQKILSG